MFLECSAGLPAHPSHWHHRPLPEGILRSKGKYVWLHTYKYPTHGSVHIRLFPCCEENVMDLGFKPPVFKRLLIPSSCSGTCQGQVLLLPALPVAMQTPSDNSASLRVSLFWENSPDHSSPVSLAGRIHLYQRGLFYIFYHEVRLNIWTSLNL